MSVNISKIVKTRKKNACWGCGKRFVKGSLLRSQIKTDGGNNGNAYWCKVCDKTIESEGIDSFDVEILFATVCKYESWKDNLKKYSRTYTKVEDEFIKVSTRPEQEVVATKVEDESIKFSTEPEQEVVATKVEDESIKFSTEPEQEVVATKVEDESVKFSTEPEQVVEISSNSNGNYIKEFFKYFKSFDVNALLNDLKKINLKYDDSDKFFEIHDDLDDFGEFIEQLLTNVENYVFESLLREDEDDRSLYLIYLTNEQENRLIGVSDNMERLQYSVNELLEQYLIGKNNETYNKNRFNDLNYLNTIPYLFVEEKILNHVETNGVVLREAK